MTVNAADHLSVVHGDFRLSSSDVDGSGNLVNKISFPGVGLMTLSGSRSFVTKDSVNAADLSGAASSTGYWESPSLLALNCTIYEVIWYDFGSEVGHSLHCSSPNSYNDTGSSFSGLFETDHTYTTRPSLTMFNTIKNLRGYLGGAPNVLAGATKGQWIITVSEFAPNVDDEWAASVDGGTVVTGTGGDDNDAIVVFPDLMRIGYHTTSTDAITTGAAEYYLAQIIFAPGRPRVDAASEHGALMSALATEYGVTLP
jgi:hypothetical protein